jgi:glycosyltransferase involved in cell wall biosynthesis
MKRPLMSVVVITHNGAATIGRAIDSIRRQSYPRTNYEIIVIDDGSTDNTAEIVKQYRDVRLVSLVPNRGIPGARNAGLTVARGDIYVGFDDDCVADRHWLARLAKAYQAYPTASGIGGELVDPTAPQGLSDLYVSARDSDTARLANSKPGVKLNIFQRLGRYFMQRPGGKELSRRTAPFEVEELYGANSSFPMTMLKSVGGWRTGMNSIEDRDICRRIKKAYPERAFVVIPTATIIHERGQNLWDYLRRQYKQGPYNFFFYQVHRQLPPLFPLPIVYGVVSLLAGLFNLWLILLMLIVLPAVLYFWWLGQAISQRRAVYICFAYIQLAEEVLVIVGLLRGLSWRIRRKSIYA